MGQKRNQKRYQSWSELVLVAVYFNFQIKSQKSKYIQYFGDEELKKAPMSSASTIFTLVGREI